MWHRELSPLFSVGEQALERFFVDSRLLMTNPGTGGLVRLCTTNHKRRYPEKYRGEPPRYDPTLAPSSRALGEPRNPCFSGNSKPSIKSRPFPPPRDSPTSLSITSFCPAIRDRPEPATPLESPPPGTQCRSERFFRFSVRPFPSRPARDEPPVQDGGRPPPPDVEPEPAVSGA